MNLEHIIEIFVGLTVLISFVYRLSQLETKIYQKINFVDDKLSKQFNDLDKKFGIYFSNYLSKNEMQDYLIHALEEKLDHKFKRCWDKITGKD